MIGQNARYVVTVLKEAGFEAYIVGGCVRDLMLNQIPKDYDVATNANPFEIKSMFKRAKIIGRRFQIVHVKLRRETIEVTTFRSNQPQPSSKKRRQTENGLLLRDNVFGSLEDDASRRDLSINALYYCPSENNIRDYTRGVLDIKNRFIRIIGTPNVRFREDPVRLLRVVRFAAKLGFIIDKETSASMYMLASNIKQISAPRLFDESLKLFMRGYSLKASVLLKKYGLFQYMLPQLFHRMENDDYASRLVEQTFINTDLRVKANKRITPAFIYAALLWPAVQNTARNLRDKGETPLDALNIAVDRTIAIQVKITAIPKRFTIPMREIWTLQTSLQSKTRRRARKLMSNPRFRAAYDFILLREQSGENLDGLGEWWTTYQEHCNLHPQKC